MPNFVRENMGSRYPVDVVCFGRTADDDLSHPTQKPVEMSKYLVRQYSDPFGVVLDCTMGTGGLLLGALMEGRVAIGIEKDEAYFNLAEERFLQQINKMKEEHSNNKNNNRKKAA